MLVSKRVKGQAGLLEFFRGTLIAQGKNGTNAANNATITVPAAVDNIQDFTDVQVGDVVYVSGESTATVFLVTAPGLTATSMTLDNNIVAPHLGGDAIWRVFRGGVALADLLVDPIPDGLEQGAYHIIYETADFGV
jgi:hypothetical protein